MKNNNIINNNNNNNNNSKEADTMNNSITNNKETREERIARLKAMSEAQDIRLGIKKTTPTPAPATIITSIPVTESKERNIPTLNELPEEYFNVKEREFHKKKIYSDDISIPTTEPDPSIYDESEYVDESEETILDISNESIILEAKETALREIETAKKAALKEIEEAKTEAKRVIELCRTEAVLEIQSIKLKIETDKKTSEKTKSENNLTEQRTLAIQQALLEIANDKRKELDNIKTKTTNELDDIKAKTTKALDIITKKRDKEIDRIIADKNKISSELTNPNPDPDKQTIPVACPADTAKNFTPVKDGKINQVIFNHIVKCLGKEMNEDFRAFIEQVKHGDSNSHFAGSENALGLIQDYNNKRRTQQRFMEYINEMILSIEGGVNGDCPISDAPRTISVSIIENKITEMGDILIAKCRKCYKEVTGKESRV